MKRRSIRWQLPVSYAAIALLAALVLGLVLLFALTGYYIQLEGNYLVRNGESIGAALPGLLSKDLPPDQLKSQVDSFALISQTRIQVLDGEGKLLADSGSPAEKQSPILFLSLSATTGSTGQPLSNYSFIINPDQTVKVMPAPNGTVIEKNVGPGGLPGFGDSVSQPVPGQDEILALPQPSGKPESVGIVSSMRMVQPFSQESNPAQRSRAKAQFILSGPTGNRLGTLIISEGPAYSRQIVTIVALAWGIASVLAVLLAALAGFFVSRRITRPVTALAKATTRMAEGDLTARAPEAAILELSQLSGAFNHMAGRIEETILALRRFAADAAHELKTPLTALRTNLELMQDEPDAARQADLMRRAQSQVEHLDRLMTGLLDLSRLETENEQEETIAFDLADLVRRQAELYASRAEQAGQEFSLEVGESTVNIVGRPAQIEQAVDNLVDNAVKFTPPGGKIRLGLDLSAKRPILWVEDSGIGIPPEDLPHLFNRFHRGRNTSGYPGSGLGSAIVRAIVQAHHAELKAENLSPSGARFSIIFGSSQEPSQ